MEHYRRHNESARDYFRHRPEDLLVLNLADSGSARALYAFLDSRTSGDAVYPPWAPDQSPGPGSKA